MEYPKIETLFDRDQKTHGVIPNVWRTPEFAYLKDNDWLFTEKVDGTNIRIMWDGKQITYGGRTDNAQIPAKLLASLRDTFEPLAESRQSVFEFDNTILYGEGFGVGIQSTGKLYNPSLLDFALFDVRIGGWWLERENIEAIAKTLKLQIVPVIGHGTLGEAASLVRNGLTSQWGNFLAEGLVVRPPVSFTDRKGHRIIGKIKTRDFKEITNAS
jgi:hypothetical protein